MFCVLRESSNDFYKSGTREQTNHKITEVVNLKEKQHRGLLVRVMMRNRKPCFNCIFGKTQIFRSWQSSQLLGAGPLYIYTTIRTQFLGLTRHAGLCLPILHIIQTVVIIHRIWDWVNLTLLWTKRANNTTIMVPNPTNHLESAQLGRRQIRGTLQRYCQKGLCG